MQGSERTTSDGNGAPEGPVFGGSQPRASEQSYVPWIIAGVVIVGLLAFLAVLGRGHGAANPNRLLPLDAHAGDLALSGVAMSESTSLSGGKSTFIDGQIRNIGSQTISGVGMQVLFGNDEGMPPQIETVPLMLIRTHEPYVDTEPVSADPLKPGDQREFRLTFESLPGNWNQQLPEIHVTRVSQR